MRRKTAKAADRATALAVVVVVHLGLLWLLLNSRATYRQLVPSMSALVRIIAPPPVKPRLGAALKHAIIHPAVFDLPTVAPPKIMVEIVKPTPEARPAPAPVAAASGSSAPVPGDRVPIPPDDFTAYLKLVKIKAQQQLDEITDQRLSQRGGVLVVALDIDRSGKILAWEIGSGEHSNVLDYETRQLIEQCDPLPPFPASIRASHLVTSIEVTFRAFGPGGF